MNAYLEMVFFSGYKETQFKFWKKLAYELMHNLFGTDGRVTEDLERMILRSECQHELILVPNFSRWVGGKWVKKYKMAYQKHSFMTDGCLKRVQTVCLCSKDVWICTECFSKHCLEAARTQSFLN